MGFSYKGSINFGLVYIPIKLETAVAQSEISFNQLDKKTQSRVRYQKTCEACNGRILDNDDIVKAYRYENDKYVIFDDEDFEKIKSKKEKGIVIEQFADLSEIDPIYFNKPYYVVPTGGEKAFSLLISAMKKSQKVAVAKTVLGRKETVVALRESNNGLLLYTLYFQDEIKKNSAPKAEDSVGSAELDMAVMIIKSMTKRFNAGDYKDEYTEKVKNAIAAKIAGQDIAAPQEKHHNVTDLMQALQLSVQRLSGQSSDSDQRTDKKGGGKATTDTHKSTAKATPDKQKSTAKASSGKKTAKITEFEKVTKAGSKSKKSSDSKPAAKKDTTHKKSAKTK